MVRTVVQRSYFALLIAAPVLLANLAACSGAYAYTPKDPTVQGMVARGISYLESNPDNRVGGMAVIGLALVKAGKPWNHPLVVQTAESIQAKIQAAGGDPSKLVIDKQDSDIYSIGTSAIFLLSYDPSTYREEIEFLLEVLSLRQKEHGGWGYESKPTGDTSMTQYAVLSMWEAHQVGFNIPSSVLDGMATWLVKTQDPGGGFGYQGKVSPGFEPIAQSEMRHSMVAAGLGSVFICSDLMGLSRRPQKKEGELSALEAVEPTEQNDPATTGGGGGRKRIAYSLDTSLIRRAKDRGNLWMKANFAIAPAGLMYIHYYLYALERYCSFRELDEGKGDRKDGPNWYNAGVEYLRQNQAEEGYWYSGSNKPVDTAFAILFLLRSTQKSIQRDRGFGAGTLVGGRGFPKDGEVVIRNGQVIAKPLSGPFEHMRFAMNNPGQGDLAEAIGRMDELGPKQSQVLVTEFAQKLRSLVSDPSPDNRIAAIKALGRSGNLENAPILILALDDKDVGVVLEARDGLRRLSRKIGGFGLPDEYTPTQHSQAVKKWRAWYQELQPDAEF